MEEYNRKSIDKENSYIKWMGHKSEKSHSGKIDISFGEIYFDELEPVGGVFEIDMNSIQVDEMEDKEKLKAHLESDEFFDIEVYPLAKFEIQSITPSTDTDRFNVAGKLTVKDIDTHISCEAIVSVGLDRMVIDTNFTLDKEIFEFDYKDFDSPINFDVHIEI